MIQVTLTNEQANAVSKALDLYSRVCSGQLEEITNLVNYKAIPLGFTKSSQSPVLADSVRKNIASLKASLGYESNTSHSILSDQVPLNARRCFELQALIDEALSRNDPSIPKFSVKRDGLTIRATQDPLPIVTIIE